MAGPYYQHRPFAFPRESFPRDVNGLIDLDSAYLPYIIDPPATVPITFNGTAKDSWVYQHTIFQKRFYEQGEDPNWIKDQILRLYCVSPYNQIAMRDWMEQALHERYEEHVFAPPPESMRRAVADFDRLDVLGAAAIGKRIALVPEALPYLAPKVKPLKNPLPDASPVERGEFYDEIIQGQLESLESPLVTPQRIVTGAIARLGRFYNNEILQEIALDRTEADDYYYPVRLRHPRFYYNLSNRVDELQIAGEQQEHPKLELVA